MRKLIIASLITMFGLVMLGLQTPVFAQATPSDPFKDACSGRGSNSTICQDKSNYNPLFGTNGVITRATQLVTIAVGAASVIMIIIGGFKYVLSNGDSNSVNSAKNTILYAVIGLVIALLAQAIVLFVLRKL